jgi:hypothetical protein
MLANVLETAMSTRRLVARKRRRRHRVPLGGLLHAATVVEAIDHVVLNPGPQPLRLDHDSEVGRTGRPNKGLDVFS